MHQSFIVGLLFIVAVGSQPGTTGPTRRVSTHLKRIAEGSSQNPDVVDRQSSDFQKWQTEHVFRRHLLDSNDTAKLPSTNDTAQLATNQSTEFEKWQTEYVFRRHIGDVESETTSEDTSDRGFPPQKNPYPNPLRATQRVQAADDVLRGHWVDGFFYANSLPYTDEGYASVGKNDKPDGKGQWTHGGVSYRNNENGAFFNRAGYDSGYGATEYSGLKSSNPRREIVDTSSSIVELDTLPTSSTSSLPLRL